MECGSMKKKKDVVMMLQNKVEFQIEIEKKIERLFSSLLFSSLVFGGGSTLSVYTSRPKFTTKSKKR